MENSKSRIFKMFTLNIKIIFIFFIFCCLKNIAEAQVPDISYSGVPSSLKINTTSINVLPTNKGGSVPANNFLQVSTLDRLATQNLPNYVAASNSLYVTDLHEQLYKMSPPNYTLTKIMSNVSYLGGLAIDSNENLYVVQQSNATIRKIDKNGVLSVLVTSDSLKNAGAMAYNPFDNSLYVVNGGVYKISLSNGSISEFLPKNYKSIGNLNGISFDYSGNMYLPQYDHISIINQSGGKLDTSKIGIFAGKGGIAGNQDGYRLDAKFLGVYSITFDKAGNAYVPDYFNGTIRKISTNDTVSTIAGNPNNRSITDGIGTNAYFGHPKNICVDFNGNLFVTDGSADGAYARLRKISTTGYTISPSLPAGLTFSSLDGKISGKPTVTSPLTTYTITAYNSIGSSSTKISFNVASLTPNNADLSKLTLSGELAITPSFSSSDTIYTIHVPYSIQYVSFTPTAADANAIVSFKGVPISYGSSSPLINLAVGVNFDTISVLSANGNTRKNYSFTINRASSTPAPTFSYSANSSYPINFPITLAPTNSGGLVPKNIYNYVSTYSNSNLLHNPGGIVSDRTNGNLYIANSGGNNILKIDNSGNITVYAGQSNNTSGYVDGANLTARFNNPYGITLDDFGNLYVADFGNNVIRKISSQGVVSTIAGNGNKAHLDASGLSASFYLPVSVAYDQSNGYLYVADQGTSTTSIPNYRLTMSIRRIDLNNNNTVTTILSNYTNANLWQPDGLALDLANNFLYVANGLRNTQSSVIRMDLTSKIATKIVSFTTASAPFNGMVSPFGLALDFQGRLWVSEYGSNIIQFINNPGTSPTLKTFAGKLDYSSGNSDGLGSSASFSKPQGITIDADGNLFVTDAINNSIREVFTNGYTIDKVLPAGLNFDNTTGIISGIPTLVSKTHPNNYNITAYNSGGSKIVSIALNIGIADSTTWVGGSTGAWKDSTNWYNKVLPSNKVAPIFNTSASIIVDSGAFAYPQFPYLKLRGSGTNITLIQKNFTDSLTLSDTLLVSKGNSINIVNSGNLSFPKLLNSGTFTLSGCNGIINTPNGIVNSGTINITDNNTRSPIFNSTITIDTLFNNYGNFNLLSGSILTLGDKNNCRLNNNGVFRVSDSSQVQFPVNLTGANLTNGGGSTATPQTSWFYVSPKSIVSIADSTQKIYNINPNPHSSTTITGEFILQSDIDNSATIMFPPNQTTTLNAIGKFRVQRFITGKNDPKYRAYRLISSPVNAVSADPSQTQNNYVDYGYLSSSWTDNNTNITYNGVSTAGIGGTSNGFSLLSPNGYGSLYLYRESLNPPDPSTGYTDGYSTKFPGVTSISAVGTNSPTLGWRTSVPNVSPTGTSGISPGNGLLMFFMGSNTRTDVSPSTPPDDATITYYGYLNQGSIPCFLWFNSTVSAMSYASTDASDKGINLVGNPYASMIDLNQVASDNSNFTTFYELDNLTHNYLTYSYDPSTNTAQSSGGNASEFVASGQGFFVTATGLNQTLTFNPNQQFYDQSLSTLTSTSIPEGILSTEGGTISSVDKNLTSSYALNSIKSLAKNSGQFSSSNQSKRKKPRISTGMHVMLKLDSINYCETGIYFDKSWTDKFDKNDARDLEASGQKVFLSSYTSDGKRVSINSLNSYLQETDKLIKLYVKAIKDGTYNLSISDMANIDTSITQINLIDKYKNSLIDLIGTKVYSFNILTADTNTYGANRFELEFTTKPLPAYRLQSFNGKGSINTINVDWTTVNEGNSTNFGLQKLNPKNIFSTMDSLQGNGKGSYQYIDTDPQNGNNSYRLVQTDRNGDVTYSKIITVKYGSLSKNKDIMVYPNPVLDATTIDFSGLSLNLKGNYNIAVYNTNGNLVIETTSNETSANLNLSGLKPGLYIVHIKSNDNIILARTTLIKK